MPDATNALFSGVSDAELIQRLSDLGFAADPGIPRAKLEEALNRFEKQRYQDSQKASGEATDYYYTLYGRLHKQTEGARGCTKETEPPVKIQFSHQDGDTELKFSYDGGHGFVKSDEKHVQKLPRWHFVHGMEYTVPWSVHQHINSLVVQDSKATEGADGFVRSVIYFRRRAISEPRLTLDDMKRMQTTGPAPAQKGPKNNA